MRALRWGCLQSRKRLHHHPDRRYYVGPRFAEEILQGHDGRHGAQILQPRSQWELEAYVACEKRSEDWHFPLEQVLVDGRVLTRATLFDSNRCSLRCLFEPTPDFPPEISEPSKILCPALMGTQITIWLNSGPLGLLNHDMDAGEIQAHIEFGQRVILPMVHELFKFLPEEGGPIPDRHLRHVSSPGIWCRQPAMRKRPWIEDKLTRMTEQLAMLREGLASGKLPEAEADTEWPHSQPQLSD